MCSSAVVRSQQTCLEIVRSAAKQRSCVQTVAAWCWQFYNVRSLCAGCCRSGAALSGMELGKCIAGSLAGMLCSLDVAVGEFLVCEVCILFCTWGVQVLRYPNFFSGNGSR